MNNNKRVECIKAVAIILLVIFKLLPVTLQIFISISGFIYLVFEVVRLKKDGNSKYRIVASILLALTVFLVIVSKLIEVKYTELRIYQQYIHGVCWTLFILAFIPLPLLDRYKEGEWKNIKPIIWIPLLQIFLLFLQFRL